MEHIRLSGDIAGGWIVELHDGDVYKCVPVMAKTEDEAVEKALKEWHNEHKEAFKHAPKKEPVKVKHSKED